MHKGTYLITAVLFCTAALAACGASNSASPAPSPDSMATRFSQGSMDEPALQGSMDDPASQGSLDDPATQASMDCLLYTSQPIRVSRRRCTLDYHQVPHILLELAVRLRNPDINEVSVIDKASQRLPFF